MSLKEMAELKPVSDGVYLIDAPFDGVPLMLYLIESGDTLALIDSGIATTPDTVLLPIFAKLGRGPDLLVNTHGHVDHFGGNAGLKAVYPGLKIAAHWIDARWIEDVRRHVGEFYMQMPDDWFFDDGGEGFLALCGGNTPVDIRLDDGQKFTVGDRTFSIVRTQGHSPGHIMLHDPVARLAITGDVALGWGPPTAEGTPDAPSVFYDADAYLAGGRAAMELEADLFLTGHFGVLDREGMQKIVDDSAAFVASFDRWTLKALADGLPRTLHAIAKEVSAHIPSYEFGFHIHASSQACLERHLRRGAVRVEVINGRRHFQLAGSPDHG